MTPGLVYYLPPEPLPHILLQYTREREREGGSHAICLCILPAIPARLDRDVERDREVVKISRDTRPRGKTRRNPRLKCQSLLDGTFPLTPFFSSRECASLTRTKGETPRNGEQVTDFEKSGKAWRDFPRVSSANLSLTRLRRLCEISFNRDSLAGKRRDSRIAHGLILRRDRERERERGRGRNNIRTRLISGVFARAINPASFVFPFFQHINKPFIRYGLRIARTSKLNDRES